MPSILGGWSQTRDLKALPAQSFRDWWAKEKAPGAKANAERDTDRETNRKQVGHD
jgi:L-lactate dehydrogenase complex protein LldF